MHFAYQPRKNSDAPKYTRSSTRVSSYQRRRLRNAALLAGGLIGTILLLVKLFSGSSSSKVTKPTKAPAGTPEVVIVTVLDDKIGPTYMSKIKENREFYAKQHGYKNFYADANSYDLSGAPRSWALVPALRHAITLNPYSTYFFALSPHSMIMNTSLSITGHVMDPKRMESLMLKDKPVVPPDSVIHTFSHLKGNQIDFALTQDGEGLSQDSFILRQGEWAKFFLDTWFDPLYRTYNFQKAEGHALEHIVQWHPTILTKLALIPPRTINAYHKSIASRGGSSVEYADGDFVVRAVGCERDEGRNCDEEITPYYRKWKSTAPIT